ncbi:LOW QUALITY PROTEIN: hypothetical protein Cgig2_007630 [Carnegiea gigantea]|uniref:Uncharacterized protein n=1 Tax=Carnegiea gigantea TaxID=171969 RepID=A0A9Q1GTL8_9CARY|nr:LOW QUALITY PROTEIN: hypothetical protein Cgig2_007630 [Carnegiea gigantea]
MCPTPATRRGMLNRSGGHHIRRLRGRNDSVGLESSTQKRAATKSKIENEINTNKTKGRRPHIGLSTILTLFSLRSVAFSFKGVGGLIPNSLALGRDKLDLLRVVALRNCLFALIHKVMICLKVLVIFKLADKGQHDLAEIPEGVGAALLVALLLELDRISCGLLQLTLQPFLLGLTGLKRRWYRETSPSSHQHSAIAFTRRAKTSAMAISSSVTLGGSEAPGATKFQDLTMSWTRESLTPGSTLMKLAEGRRASGEAPLTARVATPPVFEGVRCSCLAGYVPLMTRSLIGERPIARLSPPRLTMGQKPWPHLAVPRSDESGRIAYLLGPLSNKVLPLLIPPAFGIDRHLFGSGVPSLEDRQPRPCLICIKQTRSQITLRRLSTLRIILKNQKVGRGKEELPVTRIAPPLLGSLHGFNCLSHEPKNGSRFIILGYIELEVAGGPPLVGGGLPKRVPHGLSFIPVRDVPPT